MTHGTVHWQVERRVARVGCLSIVCGMTGFAGIGRVGIVAVMAGIAIIGDGLVCPCKRINDIMVESGWCPGRLGVAGSTIGWELRSLVIGVGGGIIFCRMTPGAGIGRVVVIPIMAGSTILGNTRMCPIQGMIILVNGEGCRRPARVGGVTHGTIHRQIKRCMAGIEGLVKVCGMAGLTRRWRTCIPIRMALDTICPQVCTCQGEIRSVMVKSYIGIAGGVTGQAGRIFIHVPIHAGMPLIGFRIDVTTSTGKFSKIGRVLVAIYALAPLSLVLSRINGEKINIMLRE